MKQRLTPETIGKFQYLSQPVIHPMGGETLFVKSSGSASTGLFYSRIFSVSHESQEIRSRGMENVDFDCQDFSGEGRFFSEKSPRYVHNGMQVAFLSDQSGEFQLYLSDPGTNQCIQLTHMRHGITWYDFAADGKSVTFTALVWQSELEDLSCFQEMTAQEKQDWQQRKDWQPVEITELDYKNDEVFGIRDGSISTVFVMDITDPERNVVSAVSDGRMVCQYPVFSTDGRTLAFYGQPYKQAKASVKEIFEASRPDAEQEEWQIRQLTQEESAALIGNHPPVFLRNNREILVPGYQVLANDGFVENLMRISCEDGSYTWVLPTSEEAATIGLGGEPVSRTVYGESSCYYIWKEQENVLYFTNAWKGYQNLYRMELKEEAPIQEMICESLNVQAFDLSQTGELTLIGGTQEQPGDLYLFTVAELPSSEAFKRLTNANAWLKEYETARTEMFWVTTRDQKSEIQIWIVHPISEEAGKKYPAVLDIHGGPECTYVSDYWHEFQALAARDMFCIYTNPRGSLGYGPEFLDDGKCWNSEAVEDLLLAVDTAMEHCPIDPERIGVTGGSYGGYMTNKLIMTSKRFAAAVTQRSLVNTATSYGTGDIGFISRNTEDLSKVSMLDFLEKRARGTLLGMVDHIDTPLCILHGYLDYRCSFEQAEQLFIAMKERRPEVPVRLVMFPKDNHGITRTGKVQSQVRHLQELTDWFAQYLIKEDNNG